MEAATELGTMCMCKRGAPRVGGGGGGAGGEVTGGMRTEELRNNHLFKMSLRSAFGVVTKNQGELRKESSVESCEEREELAGEQGRGGGGGGKIWFPGL